MERCEKCGREKTTIDLVREGKTTKSMFGCWDCDRDDLKRNNE